MGKTNKTICKISYFMLEKRKKMLKS